MRSPDTKKVKKLEFNDVQKENAELLKSRFAEIAAGSKLPEPAPADEPHEKKKTNQGHLPIVPVRMHPDLKKLVLKGAQKKRKKVSEYLRDLIAAGLKRDGLVLED
jgi:hypothetical protein